MKFSGGIEMKHWPGMGPDIAKCCENVILKPYGGWVKEVKQVFLKNIHT